MKKRGTSMFRKLLAITLSLSLVIAMLAISAPHVHAEDTVNVTYLYDNNDPDKIIGITNIQIGKTHYYDINGGITASSVDNYAGNELDFYRDTLTADNGNGFSAADYWGAVASDIFKGAGMGFGYSGNSDFAERFEADDIQVNKNINLSRALAHKGESVNITVDGNHISYTGLSYSSSLNAAQITMASRIADAAYIDGEVLNEEGSKKINAQDVLERCADDSTSIYSPDDAPGYKLMNDDTEQTVISSIVTLHDENDWVSSFGLAFYDFELVPIMNDKLEMITAADGYTTLKEAAEDNIPGVTYNTDGTEAPKAYYIENKTASPATLGASYSETVSTSVSNSVESTKTFSFAESINSTTSFSKSFKVVDFSQSISIGFTAEQAFSTAYGSEETYIEENTTQSTLDVTLPPHTYLATTIQKGTTEMSLDYECPVLVTYKVAVFSMHSSKNDSIGAGGICTVFGSGNSIGGVDAVDNLYNRAIAKVDMNGFELAQGNYFAGQDIDEDDREPYMAYGIDWDEVYAQSSRDLKGCVNTLNTYRPFSSTGGTMTVISTSMNTDVGSILPLYDLDYIVADGNNVFTLAPGGTLDFSKIGTLGYNSADVDYYGYVSDGGEWVLCDENGNELTSVDGVTLQTVSEYEKLTAEKVGTYYAKFKIDEDSYNKVDGSGYITNADLSSTAIVTINVTETGLDHICTEGPWETIIASTCTAEGEQVAKCMTCGRVMYTQTVAKLDHIPVTLTTPATCTTDGSITKICGVCFGIIFSESIPALGHDDGVWKIDFEATADHNGQMTRYCTACDAALESKEFELHTHEFGYESITREPTCISNGEKSVFCLICNAAYATEQIEKSGHGTAVSVIGTPADCTHGGEMHLYCADCNKLIGSELIEPHGHAEVWLTVKEATCKETGREENTCTICKAVLSTREITKTEHVPGGWEILQQPTCTVDGLKQQTCAHCDALLGEPVAIPAHDHDNGAWVTVLEPTCTTDGEKVRECTICKGTLESEAIPALGHDDGVWTTALEASCETAGEKHKNCTRCGQLIASERIDALGHTPGPAMTCVTDQVCLVCEEVLVPADGKSHTWTDWTTYEEAGFFTEEKQIRTCTSCDISEYRYVKGTSGCHKYFPHCDGSGTDCWACNTLNSTNGFFRNLGKFIVWFFFENIITNILFPFSHGHFHEFINLDEMFGS